MDPNPSMRNFRRERVKAHLLCVHCGARAQDGDAFCRECGHGLILPEERACVTCGATAIGEGKHCPACGASRAPQAPATPPRARPRSLPRLAVMAGLGAMLAMAVSFLPAAFGQGDPGLAGVKVGDGPREVEQSLGEPDERGSEIFWQGTDGQSHHMIQWQYGLDETQIADLTVTFVDGKVHQVGALAGTWQTSDGLKIGDRLSKAGRLYGTAIEDAPIEGLTPHRYIRGSVVVRVITEAPSDQILAIGVESPKQIPLEATSSPNLPDWHGPVPSEPDRNVPPVVEDEPILPRQRYY